PALKGIEHMVGLFLNTLPLRIQTLPTETVIAGLSRTQTMMGQWSEFEQSPALIIREMLEKCRQENIFDSLVVMENYPLAGLTAADTAPLSVQSFSFAEKTLYDLTVIITALNHIEFHFSYNNVLFNPTLIARMFRQLVLIIEEMVNNPGKEASAINIWTDGEREKFLDSILTIYAGEQEREVAYMAPRCEMEEKLVDIWSHVLNITKDRIGINHNFFAFGGHSLKASLLAAALHRAFNVKIPLAAIFKYPTISTMARFIEALDKVYTFSPVPLAEKKEFYGLTSAQKRLFLLQQLDRSSSVFHGSLILEMMGEPGINLLKAAFQGLITRHESLRTSFHFVNDEPVQRVQRICAGVEFKVEQYDLSGENETDTVKAENIAEFIRGLRRAFDLGKAPLLRAILIKLSGSRYILAVDIHHIIADGISRDIFIKEFTALYAGHGLLPLPELQYTDFSEWKNRRLQSGELKKQEEFWLREFAGELPLLDLPFDFPRPPIQRFTGDRIHFLLERELKVNIAKFIKDNNITLFMFLLAVYNVLLSRYSGQYDITVGSPSAGRTHAGLENLTGLLIDTIAIRSFPVGEKRFSDYLAEIKECTLAANENQDYPFKELTAQVANENDLGRNPLFTVMLNVLKQTNINPETALPGLKIKLSNVDFKVSWVDLTVEVIETDDDISIEFEYCTALFKRRTVTMMTRDFTGILKQALETPDIRLQDFTMINEPVMPDFMQLDTVDNGPMPVEKLIFESFAEMAAKIPDHIAVLSAGGQFTYDEMNRRANCFARLLRSKGLKPGGIAAIMMDRSVDMIIAVLGVLKAGGSYLPIDPDYPPNRILFMLNDSRASFLITKET
ncbi:MAG: condensation domain-containing protein, partial [Acidobacteria bacterium]|nr:condensation domain-containing protein [Acidobacteriota bacterium]